MNQNPLSAVRLPTINRTLQNRLEAVMGPLPEDAFQAPRRVVAGDLTDCGEFFRQGLRITAPGGTVVTAWLLKPKRPLGSGVVALHPTIACGKDDVVGLSGRENRAYGSELAARGHVVIAPDYPGFGESQDDPYALGFASATMMGIMQHAAAVSVLLDQPEVTLPGVGCIGHSLGGHNGIFLAVFDQRVAAVVSNCGLSTFASYRGGDLSGWSSRHYMPRIARDFANDPARVPFDFPELLEAILPRAVCVSAPLADSCFDYEGARACLDSVQKAASARGLPPGTVLGLHPDCGHDFPPETREAAYQFLNTHIVTQ